MSWFFGRKKNKDSPSSDSGEEASSSTQGDDYVVIEKPSNSSLIMSGDREENSSIKSFGGLYPDIADSDQRTVSRMPIFPTVLVAENSRVEVLCDSQTYLNCIKFRLNKKFESHSAIDILQADQILTFILRISSEKYDYDFSLENSVVNEMVNDEI